MLLAVRSCPLTSGIIQKVQGKHTRCVKLEKCKKYILVYYQSIRLNKD